MKVLVTSREPLHVAPEQTYTVDPLRLEDAELLFTARARSVERGVREDRARRELVDARAQVQERLQRLDVAEVGREVEGERAVGAQDVDVLGERGAVGTVKVFVIG